MKNYKIIGCWMIALAILFSGCQKNKTEISSQLKEHFAIELTNPLSYSLLDQALVLEISQIKKHFADFNPLNCEFLDDQKKPVAFQVDDLNGDKEPDEIALLVNLNPGKNEIICNYGTDSLRPNNFPVRTYARLAWETADANIGWESNRAAYRFYWGQLEAFGKLDERLIMANFTADYGYHEMQDWGMDILHVGNASGLGGISIWEGETRISTINPAGKGTNQYTRKVISAGPVRSIVQVDIQNTNPPADKYKISLIMSAFVNNIYSQQDIWIFSPDQAQIIYSPGIEKLPKEEFILNKEKGYLANWGEGAPGAGEVGLALIFRSEEYVGFAENDLDRYVKLSTIPGEKRTFWIVGGWHQGIAAPEPPQASSWFKKICDLSTKLLCPLKMEFKSAN